MSALTETYTVGAPEGRTGAEGRQAGREQKRRNGRAGVEEGKRRSGMRKVYLPQAYQRTHTS